MDIINIEQISEKVVGDDCLALVCYVDVENVPKKLAKTYMKTVGDELTEIFSKKDVKVLVLPSQCKLEVLLRNPEDEKHND